MNKSKNKGISSVVIVIAGVVVIGAAAAGYFILSKKNVSPAGISTKEKGGIVKVETQGKTEKYTGEDGVTYYTGEDIKLPAGIKSDTPLYPGAKITMAAVKDGKASIEQVSQDDAAKITEWYKTELAKLGWKFVMGSSDSMTFSKGDQSAALSVSSDSFLSSGQKGNFIIFNAMNDSDLEFMTSEGSTSKEEFIQETKEAIEDLETVTGQDSGVEFGDEYE